MRPSFLRRCCALFFMSLSLLSPLAAREPVSMPLWPGPPPGEVANAGPGNDTGDGRLRNVGLPSLTVHFPETSGENRRVLLVCPGGGYVHLANHANGNNAIALFTPKNVVVVVLKYRTTPPYTGDTVAAHALADARRAVRLIRHHAKDWGVDPSHLAMIGWSAGANLTLNLASHPDQPDVASADPVEHHSSRPDAVALMAPWPHNKKIAAYPISKDTPPAFVASARDDETAPTVFAEQIAAAYKTAGVPFTFWQVDTGGHRAFSRGSTGEGTPWPAHFWTWLETVSPQR